MTTTGAKKRSANKSAKPSRAAASGNRRKAKRLSWFDRFIRSLPFSPQELQKGFTIIALILGALLLLVVAQWFGLPRAAYQQYGHLAAKAGMEVKRVEITGMNRVDQMKVYDIVLAEKDRAMPLVDVDKIRADLMQYGWIKDVRVSRRLPDTLVVDITERKPSAVWQHGGKTSLIDAEGIVLSDVAANKADDLPKLQGEGANLQAVALAKLLESAPSLKSQIIGATWVGNRRWDLAFKTGETLALPEGDDESSQALVKFARMDGINRLLGRDLIYFDLRDPDRAYLRKAPKAEPITPVAKSEKSDSKSKPNSETKAAPKAKEKA